MATTLTSMKIDRKAREDAYATEPASMDRPVYPYGLSITLDDDALEKLGLTTLPEVGGTLTLTASVDVTSTSENESTSGKKGTHIHRSVGLQITALALEKPAAKKDTATTLYDAAGASK